MDVKFEHIYYKRSLQLKAKDCIKLEIKKNVVLFTTKPIKHITKEKEINEYDINKKL